MYLYFYPVFCLFPVRLLVSSLICSPCVSAALTSTCQLVYPISLVSRQNVKICSFFKTLSQNTNRNKKTKFSTCTNTHVFELECLKKKSLDDEVMSSRQSSIQELATKTVQNRTDASLFRSFTEPSGLNRIQFLYRGFL